LGVLAVILVLFVARKILARAPRYRRTVQDDLTKFFKTLFERGYDRGFLVIEAPRDRFIQFSKYIRKKGDLGLQFDFPLAPWSEKYYETLKRTLYERGIDYEIQSTGEDTIAAFISIDCKKDFTKAMDVAKLVLVEVFLLQPTDKLKLYFYNINPRDERVGF
jgi:hypothetical protein